jgi:predicted translin family RNA/ssDNA-binding protein
MAVVANLTAILTANTSRYQENLKKAQSTTTQMTKSVQQLGSQINRFGGLITAGGLLVGLQRTVKHMDDVGDAAVRMGISVESLSKMAYAAQFAQLDMQQLEIAVRSMQKAIADTPQKVTELGISLDKINGQATDEQMLTLLEAIVAIENPAQRAAKAMEIFGARVGTKLLVLMNDGAKGIRELYEEAERLGLVFGKDTAEKAGRLNDQIDRLKGAIQGVMIQAADTGGLEAMSVVITEVTEGVIWLTEKYAQLLRVFGVELNASDTINAVREETLKQIKVLERSIQFAERFRDTDGARAKQIAGMREEIQRLETVLKNTSQYLDEDGNLVNPNKRAKKQGAPMIDFGDGGKSASAAAEKTQDELAAIFEKTRTPLEKYNAEVARLNALRKELGEDTYNRAIEQAAQEYKNATDKADELNDAGKELGLTFTSAFEDAIVEGKKFSDVLRSMAQDIVRLMARRMVTEPLMSSLGGVFDVVGKSVTGALGGLFGGAFANGGQPPVGRMSLVGERGAELFVPRVNGTIVPNEMLGGSQNVYNIDARGTDSSVIRRLEQTIQSLAGAGVIEARVADAQRRGAL